MCFLKAIHQKGRQQQIKGFTKVQHFAQQKQVEKDESQVKTIEEVEEKQKESSQNTYSPQEAYPTDFYIHFMKLGEIMWYNTFLMNMALEKNSIFENIMNTFETELKQEKLAHTTKFRDDEFVLDYKDRGDYIIENIFKKDKFKYKLTFAHSFPRKLYKQRNFDMELKLVDSENNQVLNSNSIPVTFGVYTDAEEPTVISETKAQLPMVKGNCESEIYHGRCEFNKLHLREVSSYFPKGVVTLIVYAKAPSFSYVNTESRLEKTVDYKDIKPMVLTDVIVRAKKK